MARYLLVAHQTAESPELLGRAQELAASDAEAEFVLLVPATQVCDFWVCNEEESWSKAHECAGSTKRRLEQYGLRVTAARVGDENPLNATADELRLHGGYDCIVVSTLPPGKSRWLKLDLFSRARRLFPGLRIEHIIAQTMREPVQEQPGVATS
jgi:hypothetical protein